MILAKRGAICESRLRSHDNFFFVNLNHSKRTGSRKVLLVGWGTRTVNPSAVLSLRAARLVAWQRHRQMRGSGLVGFKFNNGAGDQYGWVRVKMPDGRKNMFWVIDYAYGDPGEPVLAGQTGPNTSAPELESLGGLVLGGRRVARLAQARQTLAH